MKYFGTDGIRDKVNGPFLQKDFVNRVGIAIGKWLHRRFPTHRSIYVLIGKDTRSSGSSISFNLACGLHSEDIKIFDGGITPTPGVAHCIQELDLHLGIVITASHNPASDNGIKLFLGNGKKLSPEDEANLEKFIDDAQSLETKFAPPPEFLFDTRKHYLQHVEGQFSDLNLNGLNISIDCANGATYLTSPEVLVSLGASVSEMGVSPSGENINDGIGSEHTEKLIQLVKEKNSDVGIAHDGDGDRVIFIDKSGKVLDGDAIMSIVASHLADTEALNPPIVVTTVMSNLGLDNALGKKEIKTIRTPVGDRNVFYEMEKNNAIIGGESSGHFILRNYATTGDGLVMALQLLKIISTTGKTLEELSKTYHPFPQLKENLVVKEKLPLESIPELINQQKASENELGDDGRILIRYSGTENKIRILVEASDADLAKKTMDPIVSIIKNKLCK